MNGNNSFIIVRLFLITGELRNTQCIYLVRFGAGELARVITSPRIIFLWNLKTPDDIKQCRENYLIEHPTGVPIWNLMVQGFKLKHILCEIRTPRNPTNHFPIYYAGPPYP